MGKPEGIPAVKLTMNIHLDESILSWKRFASTRARDFNEFLILHNHDLYELFVGRASSWGAEPKLVSLGLAIQAARYNLWAFDGKQKGSGDSAACGRLQD